MPNRQYTGGCLAPAATTFSQFIRMLHGEGPDLPEIRRIQTKAESKAEREWREGEGRGGSEVREGEVLGGPSGGVCPSHQPWGCPRGVRGGLEAPFSEGWGGNPPRASPVTFDSECLCCWNHML